MNARDEAGRRPVLPSAEALRLHAGKVVAFDEQGRVRKAAATWDEMGEGLSDEEFGRLSFMYVVPPGAGLIG